MKSVLLATLALAFAAPVTVTQDEAAPAASTQASGSLTPLVSVAEDGSLWLGPDAKEKFLGMDVQELTQRHNFAKRGIQTTQHFCFGGRHNREPLHETHHDPCYEPCFEPTSAPPHRASCEPCAPPCNPCEPCDPCDPCDPCCSYDGCCDDSCCDGLKGSCCSKWFCPSTDCCVESPCLEAPSCGPLCCSKHPIVDGLCHSCVAKWLCPSTYCPSNWCCDDACCCDVNCCDTGCCDPSCCSPPSLCCKPELDYGCEPSCWNEPPPCAPPYESAPEPCFV